MSKFVIKHVENGVHHEYDDFGTRIELLKKITKLEGENDQMQQLSKVLGLLWIN